ncbi:expressed unknown protein [Seminavis robusta]|uniref:Uncharacterized protein n=1 Tax=Seminavis robusta TaxID=568900 RepID=A0A9N8E0U0_9STRA|nr:expressed unknown protein [Seminavis robusta]|eukprot:Sro507_g156470.1 n/a (252) ;mRNA; f:17421-18176
MSTTGTKRRKRPTTTTNNTTMDSSTSSKVLFMAAASLATTCDAFSMVAPPLVMSLARPSTWKTTALHHPLPPGLEPETATLAQEILRGTPFLADPSHIPQFAEVEEQEEEESTWRWRKDSKRNKKKDTKAKDAKKRSKVSQKKVAIDGKTSTAPTTAAKTISHNNVLLREVADFLVQEFDNQQVAKGRVLMAGAQTGQTMDDVVFAQDSLQDLWRVAGEAVVDFGLYDQAPGLSLLDLNGAVSLMMEEDVN